MYLWLYAAFHMHTRCSQCSSIENENAIKWLNIWLWYIFPLLISYAYLLLNWMHVQNVSANQSQKASTALIYHIHFRIKCNLLKAYCCIKALIEAHFVRSAIALHIKNVLYNPIKLQKLHSKLIIIFFNY